MALLFPPLRPNFAAALRDASSESPRARAAAAEALGDAPDERREEALEALRPLVDDTQSTVRAAAMTSLGRLRDVGALDAIVARFEDQDPVVRQVALLAASDIGDERAIAPLRRMLRSDHPEVRFQAIGSLVALDPDDSVEPLARLTTDPDAEVRARVADALGALEDPRGAEPLAELLEDRALAVRQSAAVGLARIGDARGVPVLVRLLDDKDRCFEAAWALAELRVEEAREPLGRLAASFLKPLASKAAAGAALVRLGDPRGVEAIRAVLGALRGDARSYAAQLVGELELVELAPELAKLVDRPRGADRVVVAEALAKLAARSDVARGALESLAKDRSEAGERAKELLGG